MKRFNRVKTIVSRLIIASYLYVLGFTETYAQGRGGTGIGGAFAEAEAAVSGIFNNVVGFVYVCAGVIGLYGLFNVYKSYTNEDPNAGKKAAALISGSVFLIIGVMILKSLFMNNRI